jgi:hypothetical protein
VKRAQKRILTDVLGRVGSHNAAGDSKHDVTVALNEDLKSRQISRARPRDQPLVKIYLLNWHPLFLQKLADVITATEQDPLPDELPGYAVL